METDIRLITDLDRASTYNALVRYRYTVSGRTLTHDVVAFGARDYYTTRRRAERTAQ